MTERRIDAFFYGLFMDGEILRKAGVEPTNPRRASVDGMLFALTHTELVRLYASPGVEDYHPEAVVAQPLAGTPVPALCYNPREAPQPEERNPEYAAQLQRTLKELDFPADYVGSIR